MAAAAGRVGIDVVPHVRLGRLIGAGLALGAAISVGRHIVDFLL